MNEQDTGRTTMPLWAKLLLGLVPVAVALVGVLPILLHSCHREEPPPLPPYEEHEHPTDPTLDPDVTPELRYYDPETGLRFEQRPASGVHIVIERDGEGRTRIEKGGPNPEPERLPLGGSEEAMGNER